MTAVTNAVGSLVRSTAGFVVIVVISVAMGVVVTDPLGIRLALAVTTAGILSVSVLRSPRSVLLALVVWLAVLGLVRRLVGVDQGGLGDPLIAVGTVTWLALSVSAVERGCFTRRTSLTSATLLLICILTLASLNPLQGGVTVGLAGLLLIVVPMLAFLIGRTLVDDATLRRVFQLLFVLALASAAYGLYQTFVGLPPWDARWVAGRGYASLNVNGVIRGFGSFSAASEYAAFLGVGAVICVSFMHRARVLPIGLAALFALLAALWYESSRSILVLTVMSIGVVMAARRGYRPVQSVVVLVVFIGVVLPVAVGVLAPNHFDDAAGAALARHQVGGLTDAFGKDSTLPDHITMVTDGIRGVVRDPVGRGTGSISHTASRLGGATFNTEADPGNVAVAAGFAGLMAYAAVAVLGLGRLYRLAATRRDPLAVAALGIAAVTFLQWLNGGQYAVTFLPWLMLGWADRSDAVVDADLASPVTTAS